MLFSILLCSIFLFLLTQLWRNKIKNNSFPPGPWGLPLLGYLPLLGPHAAEKLTSLHARFGPILGMKFGSYSAVLLSENALIKEAFNEAGFAGRPAFQAIVDRSYGVRKGLAFTEGPYWEEQRRFVMKALRKYGLDRSSTELVIQDEIGEVVRRLRADLGVPLLTHYRFNPAIFNVIWFTTTGSTFRHDDPTLLEFFDILKKTIITHDKGILLTTVVPELAVWAPKLFGYDGFIQAIRDLASFLERNLEPQKASWTPDQPRHFVDAYLDEIRNCKDPNSSFHGAEGESSMAWTVTDLFVAGVEPLSVAVQWMFLYLLAKPELQRRLQAEVDGVVGSSRRPGLSDRPSMPFTEATVWEIFRHSSLVPMGMMHKAAADSTFHGYALPKGTLVISNFYAVFHDRRIWGDPETFRPDRFIANNNTFLRPEVMTPFSTGKRACLGGQLALNQLFLFLATISQHFSVSPDPGSGPPSTEPVVGSLITPRPYRIVFNLREK